MDTPKDKKIARPMPTRWLQARRTLRDRRDLFEKTTKTSPRWAGRLIEPVDDEDPTRQRVKLAGKYTTLPALVDAGSSALTRGGIASFRLTKHGSQAGR